MPRDYSAVDSFAFPSDAPRARRSVLLAALFAVSFAGILSLESNASRQRLAPVDPVLAIDAGAGEALPDGIVLPDESAQAAVDSEVAEDEFQPDNNGWLSVKVKNRDSISTIIENLGMPKLEWMELMALGKSVSGLRRLQVGDEVLLRKGVDGRLAELSYELDELRTLQVRRVDNRLEALVVAADLERRQADAHGVIRHSLFADGARAGLSDQMILEMANIFAYDIDFALDLRDGDRFSVVYEQLYKNGEKLRNGNILAAEFVNQGKVHRAIRYVNSNGSASYYSPDGTSLRKAFMRTPVDFARISSGFNLSRRHPILNIIRAHKGVDYAAPTGTPVKASGDGRVHFVGNKSGYGRVVILEHAKSYTTLYAHLSKFKSGLRVGSRVNRGQVIGYVGASGLATAPHLHYEFRVNGVHKNPMTVVLPRGSGLSRKELADWKKANSSVIARLDSLSDARAAQNQR